MTKFWNLFTLSVRENTYIYYCKYSYRGQIYGFCMKSLPYFGTFIIALNSYGKYEFFVSLYSLCADKWFIMLQKFEPKIYDCGKNSTC